MTNEETIKRYVHNIFPQMTILRKDNREIYSVGEDYRIYKVKERGWYFKQVNKKYEEIEIGPITLQQSLSILCTKVFEGLLRKSQIRLWEIMT